jgi:hypothetical protein
VAELTVDIAQWFNQGISLQLSAGLSPVRAALDLAILQPAGPRQPE